MTSNFCENVQTSLIIVIIGTRAFFIVSTFSHAFVRVFELHGALHFALQSTTRLINFCKYIFLWCCPHSLPRMSVRRWVCRQRTSARLLCLLTCEVENLSRPRDCTRGTAVQCAAIQVKPLFLRATLASHSMKYKRQGHRTRHAFFSKEVWSVHGTILYATGWTIYDKGRPWNCHADSECCLHAHLKWICMVGKKKIHPLFRQITGSSWHPKVWISKSTHRDNMLVIIITMAHVFLEMVRR